MPTSPSETISFVKDLTLTLTAFAGMLVALHGLETWKRQLKGGAEYTLARSLLKHVLLLREALRTVRNPVMWSSELSIGSEQRAGLSPDLARFQATVDAYNRRWETVQLARTELDVDTIEAEVLWGREVREAIHPLVVLQAALHRQLYIHLEVINPNTTDETRQAFNKNIGERNETIYELSEDDSFNVKVQNAVECISAFLATHLVR